MSLLSITLWLKYPHKNTRFHSLTSKLLMFHLPHHFKMSFFPLFVFQFPVFNRPASKRTRRKPQRFKKKDAFAFYNESAILKWMPQSTQTEVLLISIFTEASD